MNFLRAASRHVLVPSTSSRIIIPALRSPRPFGTRLIQTDNASTWDQATWAIVKGSLDKVSSTELKKPEDAWADREPQIQAKLKPIAVPDAYTGRTVLIGADNTFQTALNQFHGILNANNVRHDQRANRYFIKPYAMRQKLKSSRWRRKFSQIIREKVRIVHAIRQRGM